MYYQKFDSSMGLWIINAFIFLNKLQLEQTIWIIRTNGIKPTELVGKEDVERWQYLSKVKIPNIDADVIMLIGSDAPEILEPKQVIPSQNGGPYATRTTLAWVVNGPLGKVTNDNTRTANIIKANLRLNEQFQSYCDVEFNNSAYSEAKSMSTNNKSIASGC